MTLEARVHAAVGHLRLDVELSVAPGETVVILGPNGAGKTTLLRALAGLVSLEGGRVSLDGAILAEPDAGVDVRTELRSIGFVFQDYLLFPHLSVEDNVAFGLRVRGRSRDQARAVARGWLELMELSRVAGERPRALSGGQAQRVALARALATSPRLLLLDEPLAALDAGARVEVRHALTRHLKSFQGVRVIVTHDPLEAMLLGDRVVVIESGRVVQSGSMEELRARPRSAYVADLVGLNVFRGRATNNRVRLPAGVDIVVSRAPEGEVFAAVHPRSVSLFRTRPEGSPRNTWPGRVEALDAEGDRVRVSIGGAVPLVAEVTAAAVADLGLLEGVDLWTSIKATEVQVYLA